MPQDNTFLPLTFDGNTNTTRFFTLSGSTSIQAFPAWPSNMCTVVNRTNGNVFLLKDNIFDQSERFLLMPDEGISLNIQGNTSTLSCIEDSASTTGLIYIAASPFAATVRG